MRKKVIVSVTNDISTDQRVFKVCNSLQAMGFEVELIGVSRPWSVALNREYICKRIKICFNIGPLFYFEYNIRLFFLLLFKPASVLLSNDLDTLLANYLISKLKNIPLVYDSHELFPEAPELLERPLKKRLWECLESFLLPKIKHAYTVCESIQLHYKALHGIDMKVVRNVPNLCSQPSRDRNTKTLLYQGNINPGRGLEVAIKSMSFLPDYRLKIIGNGIGLNKLKLLSESEGVSNQVEFLGRLPFEDLKKHTESASIGILFEEPLGLSFEYSLPNKLFDYIHAETPVIASPLIEVKKILEKYNVGELLVDRNPEHIAQQIQAMEYKLSTYEFIKAKAELNWKNEHEVLESIFSIFQDKVKN